MKPCNESLDRIGKALIAIKSIEEHGEWNHMKLIRDILDKAIQKHLAESKHEQIPN